MQKNVHGMCRSFCQEWKIANTCSSRMAAALVMVEQRMSRTHGMNMQAELPFVFID